MACQVRIQGTVNQTPKLGFRSSRLLSSLELWNSSRHIVIFSLENSFYTSFMCLIKLWCIVCYILCKYDKNGGKQNGHLSLLFPTKQRYYPSHIWIERLNICYKDQTTIGRSKCNGKANSAYSITSQYLGEMAETKWPP